MELEYRKDFEDVRKRWADFWDGKNTRPMVTCTKAKEGTEPAPAPNHYHAAFGDIDKEIEKTEAWANSHEFLADSIPSYMVTFTADHFTLFFRLNYRQVLTQRAKGIGPGNDLG